MLDSLCAVHAPNIGVLMSKQLSHPLKQQMLTVNEFVSLYRISRASLYRFWSRNKGPKRVQVGKRVLISVRAAEDWIKQLAKQTSAFIG